MNEIIPFNWKRDKNDVMLKPDIFQQIRRSFRFKPGVDFFASDTHHQLLRYYALEKDPKAAGKDAFKVNWLLEYQSYTNPPWVDISRCLDMIQRDQAQVMMVVPK